MPCTDPDPNPFIISALTEAQLNPLHLSRPRDPCAACAGFFDIHPPLGKLILAYASYLLGYRPDPTFVIEKIGHVYPSHVNYVLVRYVSASFSCATVPLTYAITRALRVSRWGGVLSASSVLLDLLGLIEGRLILMDSQLVFFCQIALLCALKLWRLPYGADGATRSGSGTGAAMAAAAARNAHKAAASEGEDAARRARHTRQKWLLITGLAAGAALSIKHTALATPGLIAIVSFFGLHFPADMMPLRECVTAGLAGLCVYVTSFYIMFRSLWKTGGKYDNFMPDHFKRTLIGGPMYDASAKRVWFVRLFLYMNARMVQSNANIKKRHSWESSWYQWIANWRGMLYYVLREEASEEREARRSQVYLLGNPVVIYMVLGCVTLFAALTALSVRYREWFAGMRRAAELRRLRGTGVFLLSGWLCNLLPYILVDRAAFIYHYLPGLFYGQLLCGLMVDVIPGARWRAALVMTLVAAMAAAFVYWSPWAYAVPLTNEQHARRRWLPRWT